MAILLENMLAGVQNEGLNTNKNAVFGGNLTVSGTTNIAAVTLTDITTTGNTTLGNAVTDTTAVNGATTVTSTSASALTVGANGATNPVLKVDAATASVATGLNVTGAAAAGGLAVAVVSSGTNENLTVDAKGSGTISLNVTGTGNIVLGRAATGVSLAITGAASLKNATAIPATAGAVAAGAPIVSNSNLTTIEWTTDAPTHTRPKGSVVFNINGSSTSTRMYINTDGAGTWTAVTTAA